MSANSGAHLAIGSSSLNLPSSISISAAAEVTGLVIEAMRNRVSRVIGWSRAMSRRPVVLTWAISPLRQIRVTAPDRSPAPTTPSRTAGARASASWSKPLSVAPASSMPYSRWCSVIGWRDDSGEKPAGLRRPCVKTGTPICGAAAESGGEPKSSLRLLEQRNSTVSFQDRVFTQPEGGGESRSAAVLNERIHRRQRGAP